MDAYAHREAVGRRFSSRIAAGDAVFLAGSAGIPELPCTVTNGERRLLGGVNRFMLMQVMADREWVDPRFFTLDQVQRAGWTLAPDAKRINLQFLKSTGNDGLPLEMPQSEWFGVFNAGEIVGVPAIDAVVRSPLGDLEGAAGLAGFAVGEDGLRAATDRWLSSLQGVRAVDDPLGAALRVQLASSLLEVQAGLPGTDGGNARFAADWAQGINADPLSFFQAVKDAEGLAATVMAQAKAVGVERAATEELARVREAAVAVTAKVEGNLEVGMMRNPGATARVEAMFAEREAVLAVLFEDKDRVYALGGVYYGPQKLWFVPKGKDVDAFKEWNPRVHSLGMVATDNMLIDDFMQEMSRMGLSIPRGKTFEDDGQWHNITVDAMKKKGNLSGSYMFSLNGGRDGGAIGYLSNKYTGERSTWTYEGELLTPEQRAKMRAAAMERAAQADRELAAKHEIAAGHAAEIVAVGLPANEHGYVVKKGISSEGLLQVSGSVLLKYQEFYGESGKSAIRPNQNYLIVPMSNAAGELRAIQAISPDGSVKSFMRGAQKKGTMCVLGAESFDAIAKMGVAAVAYNEGVATGASFRAASGMPVVVCFDAGNLETVVAETSARLPAEITRVLGVDDDQYHVERALGFLSENLGMSPHAPSEARILVSRGGNELRQIAIGEAIADGQWHQVARGGYSMTLNRDEGSEAVRSIAVDILPTDTAKKLSAIFVNRGIEAGRTAMRSIEADGKRLPDLADVQVVMAIPKFKSLAGRPSDWNDLVKAEGVEAARAVLRTIPGCEVTLAQEVPEKVVERVLQRESRQVAGLSR